MTDTLTTRQAADRANEPLKLIQYFIRAGKLQASKRDGKYQIDRVDLDEFMKSRNGGDNGR